MGQHHRLRKGRPYAIALLCFAILFVVGCGQTSGGQMLRSGGKSSTGRGEITYVAIGASDTFGFGTDDPYSQNWASDLAVEIGPRVHLINLGIPGVIVHDALNLELPVALDSHPDLVTIWLAVNDIVDKVPVKSYARNLDLLVSRLQARSPHVIIAMANVPDLTLLPHFSKFDAQALRTQIMEYNATIGLIVNRHHLILVDLSQQAYNLKNHPEYISGDGLHPSYLGYLQLAELFYMALPVAIRKEGKLG